MSTKVTMTISDSSSSSAQKLGCNIQILKTKDGILKILEVLIPLICLSMIFKGDVAGAANKAPLSAFILVLCNIGCCTTTSLLLLSFMMSPMATNLIPKMVYECLNNVVSSVYYVIASLTFLIMTVESDMDSSAKEKPIAVAVLGLMNSILYFVSAYFSYHAFKSA